MKIRPATPDDCSAIAHIQVDSYRRAYAGILPKDYLDHFSYEEQTQDWLDLLSGPQDSTLLVAEEPPGEMLAYALGHVGSTGVPGYEGELDALHVRKDAQQRGIGRALIAAAAQKLHQSGAVNLVIWVLAQNYPARALYSHLGGQVVEKRLIQLGEGDIAAEEVVYGWPDITALFR